MHTRLICIRTRTPQQSTRFGISLKACVTRSTILLLLLFQHRPHRLIITTSIFGPIDSCRRSLRPPSAYDDNSSSHPRASRSATIDNDQDHDAKAPSQLVYRAEQAAEPAYANAASRLLFPSPSGLTSHWGPECPCSPEEDLEHTGQQAGLHCIPPSENSHAR